MDQTINSTLPYCGYDAYSLFCQPYLDGIQYLSDAVTQEEVPLYNRVTSLILSGLLLTPLLNTIVWLALRFFASDVFTLPNDNRNNNIVDPLNIQMGLQTISSAAEQIFSRIQTLMNEGRVDEAWVLYRGTNRNWRNDYERALDLEIRHYLPPENLIRAVIAALPSTEEIIREITNGLERDSIGFLRDCAIAYEAFRNQCFEDDKLWNCFTGYETPIADISTAHPSFALKVISSSRKQIIGTDDVRLEIFRAAYPKILEAIGDFTFTFEQTKHIVFYLLSFSLVIPADDFEKIQAIREAFASQETFYDAHGNADSAEGLEQAKMCIYLIDLLMGKLYMQGVFGRQPTATAIPLIDESMLDNFFNEEWMEMIASEIATATAEEEIRRGLLYLSLISEDYPGYASAQMTLGNTWFYDLDDPAAAVSHYLKASTFSDYKEEAEFQVKTCLIAKVREGSNWRFIARDQMETLREQGGDVATLSPQDCRSLSWEQVIPFLPLPDEDTL
jgi:hypothetical protein